MRGNKENAVQSRKISSLDFWINQSLENKVNDDVELFPKKLCFLIFIFNYPVFQMEVGNSKMNSSEVRTATQITNLKNMKYQAQISTKKNCKFFKAYDYK